MEKKTVRMSDPFRNVDNILYEIVEALLLG